MGETYDNPDTFIVEACKCKRCGRILISKDAVKKGMGCTCEAKAKAEEEARKPFPGQIDIFDWIERSKEK